MFGLLRSKLLLIGGAVMAFLIGIIKFQSIRNAKIKNERDKAVAGLRFKEDVIDSDAEIDQEFSHRAKLAEEAIDAEEIPEHLKHPRK